jgi:twitching motility protein PilJ
MSDVIKNPVAGTHKNTTDANSTWKLLLGLSVLVSVVCLFWLVKSLSLVSQYLESFNQSVVVPVILFVLGVLGILFALYQLLQQRGGSERLLIEKETLRRRQEAESESERARQIQEENERNQIAILRLLDELGDLADGDLTVNATVSEDFTGAIADSVNFAIDQLRQLVLVINSTADRVSQSSEETQMNAIELAEASEHQAQEIAGVSAAINEMTVSIDQVSNNAAESATVAQRSVAISYNGAEVVQRSIEGMNVIRDQIQETSKRIKRLGESSQEIGDIVGLINDIADQTNVLALNAAIQASMAGEAGRGFAVVADEVQRLAERSANATKQIETLVKTIQADTSEAVMSMESTTSEVVRGARLAKDAGEALEEVQTVSNTLADLIQNISNAAMQQAESAGHISHTMNIIQDITSQTSSGTMATARSIGELNEMAAALQESVTGFKISNDDEQLGYDSMDNEYLDIDERISVNS